ncbi:MAG: T9SS type A sorting domain-containing protein [Chitinophagales bacterium]
MKLITLLLVFSCFTATAQQFHFDLSFWVGFHRDTVHLGYDPLGTDTLDGFFNEVNIINAPYDSVLNVRVGNRWWIEQGPNFQNQTPYQTKTQIVGEHQCGATAESVIEIDVVSRQWPVYVRWPGIFYDSCVKQAALTNISPWDWWSPPGFKETFSQWQLHILYPTFHWYADGNDTVNIYFVSFGDSLNMYLPVPEVADNATTFSIYPNPVATSFTVSELTEDFGDIRSTEVYSVEGQLVKHATGFDGDMTFLASGLYYVALYNNQGRRALAKVIKTD